jgi:AraC-like DNA-binding protein
MRPVEMSARIGAVIAKSARAAGVCELALRSATGFDPATARDVDARICLELEETLWNEAARLSGDVDFGLHTAERLEPGLFDVLDYAVRTAPTARAAIERLARYNRLEHDAAVFKLIERGATVRVEHRFAEKGVQCRHSAEFTLASHVVVGSQITGTRLAPRAVEFAHAPPSSLTEHQRIFGVTPRFHSEVNALEWLRSDLDRPVPAADPALSRVIERHAEAMLAARPAPATTHAARVQQELAGMLQAGAVSLRTVAQRLRLSPRTLQRRLASEGASFDGLLENLRCDLALRYLSDAGIGIAQVAYLLGYAEPSPFNRAFRRWTGATPSEFRASRSAPKRSHAREL